MKQASKPRPKIIRAATVPASLNAFCRGQLHWLSQQGFEVVVLSSPGAELDDVAGHDGVRAIAVPMQRRMAPLSDAASLLRLVRVMLRERPAIVHSMTPKAGLLCMIAAWIARVPVRIHTFTGLVWPTATGLKRKLLMATDRLTCACATTVNPEGHGVARDLARVTSKPLRIIGNGNVRGVDLDYWKPQGMREAMRRQLLGDDRARNAFVFLFVGRLVGDKGINELVACMERFKEQPAVKLVLVGDYENDLDPLLPITMQRINGNHNIITAGHRTDVRPYYEMADAFVFPSYREGFPNTVLEAGAMGLAQIVTNVNGANEIIADGKNGLIVPPRNAEALYQAMARFTSDKALVIRLAAQARPMVASRYEQRQLWQALLTTYRTALK